MIATTPNVLAMNPQALDALKYQAHQQGGQTELRFAAQQFESFFVQMMMRTMRQTLSQDTPMDSHETKMFSEMFDQQIAQNISSGKGLGLADMLVTQMQNTMQPEGIKVQPRPYTLPKTVQVEDTEDASSSKPASDNDQFINDIWPHAVNAGKQLGVSPHVLMAQAALESGWGKHELQGRKGKSYNLFNIKAGKNWNGDTVNTDATEYVNGKPTQQSANFRAYNSYAEAFDDYTRMLKSNPRYAAALDQGADAQGFARGLQAGGYATDPAYADKVMRVMKSPAFRESLSADTPS
jgi:flagellar protein FlgJ